MPRVVLSPRYSADSIAVWQAALALGWSTARVRHAEARALVGAIDAGEVVIYGETLLADAVAGALDLGLFEPPADWLPGLPAELRLREVTLTTLAEARRGGAGRFIKPVDDKFFPARVYEAVDIDAGIDDALPVLVAEPVRFGLEVRAFVGDGQVVGLSAYIRDGGLARGAGDWPLAPAEEEAARACLDRVIAAVPLPPAVVIDVGEIVGRGWAVVEANPAWASGLCGVDARDVLPLLRRACAPRHAIDPAEQRWVRPVARVE
ncbi:MAG: ATP-grasp domain-containing protein [Myxococcales bacterium]|nr:ATP-grasp domain-containing protein [Myxococcales bacterium]